MDKQDALATLAALGQETRLDVFRLLVPAAPAGLPAGEIAEALGVAPATLSFHLKELKNAGVVRVRREGRSLHYAPRFDAMRELVAYLTENCCEGVPSAAKRHRAPTTRQA